MSVTAKWYGLGLKHALSDVNLLTDTLKAAILTSSYTPAQDTDQFWSDISSNEVTGTGYSAGGKTVTTPTLAYDGSVNTVTFDCDDLTWTTSTITGRILVVYKSTGTASTSPLICWQDAGTNIVSSGGSWTFTVDATGLLTASEA